MKKITDFPYISSRANPKITEAAKLADKKYRDASGCFAFEGIKLLSDACRSGYIPEAVYITERAYGRFYDELDALGIYQSTFSKYGEAYKAILAGAQKTFGGKTA